MPFANTRVLRIAYDDHQPKYKKVVILLHGWPDSPRTWNGVLPGLLASGYRVIVPALRGFGETRFLHGHTPRSGQLAALGRDLLDLIDALQLEQAPALVGHDWGARAVANAYGLRPDVASHLVFMSVGYGTNNPTQSLSMIQARRYWYHWYMATDRGQRDIAKNPQAFAQIMWDTWSPAGWYQSQEFAQTAEAFKNPDWLAVTLHSYQHRWGHAAGDPAYEVDDKALQKPPTINVPTMLLHGEADGVTLLKSTDQTRQYCKARFERHVLPGVGHFPQREDPDLVTRHLLEFLAA